MELKTYLSNLSTESRKVFAESVGTTSGHLANVSYGYKTLGEKVCVAVEQKTKGKVTRQELRPTDWQDIWPELMKRKTRKETMRQVCAGPQSVR